MPIQVCKANGKPGYKYGDEGKCYTYKAGSKSSRKRAKQQAINQGLAIEQERGGKFHG
jgi:hypothetical protein